MSSATTPHPNSSAATTLHNLFSLRPGESRVMMLLMLYAVAYSGGVITIGYDGVADALFLSRLPASNTLYLLIAPAIKITLALLLYNRVAARMLIVPLMLGSTALLTAGALLFRVLFDTELSSSFDLLLAVNLFTEVVLSLIGIQLYTQTAACSGYHSRAGVAA